MREPKVSIITVCLNSVKTIEQAIQSVINQTYKNIEYIIIDGVSTDGTLDIISKYESHITKWVSEKDKGLYDAMNKGIAMATGDIIGILNSDDWYELNALETVVQAFDDETGMVYGTTEFVYNDRYTCAVKNGSLKDLVYRMVTSHTAVFVKREVYQQIGVFDLQYQLGADYDFLLRMYSNGIRMKEIEPILAHFRVGGVSSKYVVLLAEEWRNVARYHAEQQNDADAIKKIEDYYQVRLTNAYAKGKEIWLMDNRRLGEVWITNWLSEKGKLQIYGAGRCGIECTMFFEKFEIDIECFLDSSHKKQGTIFMGRPVRQCGEKDSKKKEEKNYIIVAAMNYEEEIMKQLTDLGYEKDKDFCLYSELIEEMYNEITEQRQDIETVVHAMI